MLTKIGRNQADMCRANRTFTTKKNKEYRVQSLKFDSKKNLELFFCIDI